MARLKIINEGILYKNPEPGLRAECAFLPNVTAINATELICIYRVGQAFYSSDGTLNILRSTDGGVSWTTEGMVWDISKDDRPFNYSAPHTTRLNDGTLVLNAFRVDYSDPRPQFNPDTGGTRESDKVIFISRDDGRSWSDPKLLEIPGIGPTDTPSSIIELDDGRWWLGLELWKNWTDSSPLHIKGYSTFSDDMGDSWTSPVIRDSANNSNKMFSHTRYTKMLDGRIAGLQWAQKPGSAEDYDLHLTISDRKGTSWSIPTPTGINAQTSWLADLGDNTLAAAYTTRDRETPGIQVVLSEDEGKTWDIEHQVQVWDAVGQEWLGTDRKPEYPKSHDNIAFGKPNLARLPDRSLIVSWWCTQACITHSRFAKLIVE